MPDFDTLEPIRDKFFHVEWETTLKCNLDCSYCGDGHDNSLAHPSLADSLNTVDFIFEYVDHHMKRKPKDHRHLNINVFGGESFFHPKIIDILKYTRKKRKEYTSFTCNVSTITNAVVGTTQWKRIVDYLDYFTVSFHAEALPKQREMLKENVLYLKEKDKAFQVNILMHPQHWDICTEMVQWCEDNSIRYHKRQIDHSIFDRRFNYTAEQSETITGKKPVGIFTIAVAAITNGFDLSSKGRACCGGQTLCMNQSQNTNYIYGNNFKGWSCSVNEFFLYIKQNTGEVYTNKDCKMNLDGSVGPIGYLSNTQEILKKIKENTTIICKKKSCWCGLCTPKARTPEQFSQLMTRYRNDENS